MFWNETHGRQGTQKTILKHHPKNACKYRTPMDCDYIWAYGPVSQISTMKSLHDKKNPKNPFWTSTSPDRSGSKLKSCNLHSQFGFLFLPTTSPHMHACFLWIVWILSSKFCWIFSSGFAHVNQSLTSHSCCSLDRALELQSHVLIDSCFSTIYCKINTLSSKKENRHVRCFYIKRPCCVLVATVLKHASPHTNVSWCTPITLQVSLEISQDSAKLWIRETLATTGSQKQLQKHFSSTFGLCLHRVQLEFCMILKPFDNPVKRISLITTTSVGKKTWHTLATPPEQKGNDA